MIRPLFLVPFMILLSIHGLLKAQEQPFSLENCIQYAWENSTELSRTDNSVKIQNAYLESSKAERGPNLFLNQEPCYLL